LNGLGGPVEPHTRRDEFFDDPLGDTRRSKMLNFSNTVVAASLLFLFQSANVPPAHSGERHVVLTNNTRERLIEIYASDDGIDNWQEDLLGLEFLLPGSSVFIDVDDRNGNCKVDVKTVLNNGASLVYRGVDACLAEGHAVLIR
jgi:hypothetical protein